MTPTVIFFDKDGTLIDFDAFWISVSRYALKDVLARFSHATPEKLADGVDTVLAQLGVDGDVSDIDGIIRKGTYEEMAEVVYDYLRDNGCTEDFHSVLSYVNEAYINNLDNGNIVATCGNIREFLSGLKNQGIMLCVVTTDTPEMTHGCLKKLGVSDLFEYIYSDDGVITPKPNAMCIDDFCEKTGTCRSSILMVGDTTTDIAFARNAGIPVVCVGDKANRDRLADMADAVIPDISYLPQVLEEL